MISTDVKNDIFRRFFLPHFQWHLTGWSWLLHKNNWPNKSLRLGWIFFNETFLPQKEKLFNPRSQKFIIFWHLSIELSEKKLNPYRLGINTFVLIFIYGTKRFFPVFWNRLFLPLLKLSFVVFVSSVLLLQNRTSASKNVFSYKAAFSLDHFIQNFALNGKLLRDDID